MADSTAITGGLPPVGTHQRSSYGTASEARARAQAESRGQSPQTERALKRLDVALSSDKPLRRDVPRGFYLDIKI
jgi:uncharacterized protein with LGFP repeats